MSPPHSKPIHLEWADGAHFLACFEEGPPARLRGTEPIEDLPGPGTMCSLYLHMRDREADFHLHALLADAGDGDAPVFELVPEERHRLELVLVSARGESLPYRRRRHTRVPAHFVATVTAADGTVHSSHTTTFGAGGAHFSLKDPLPVEEHIQVSVTVADDRPIELKGRVTSCIEEGPERGSSVEFLFRSSDERDQLAALADELRAKQEQ